MHVNLTWRRYKAICLVYLYPPKNIPNGDRSQCVIHDIHARKTFYTIYPPKNIPNCSSGQCTVHDILVRTYLILSLYPPMDMTNGHNSQCMIPDIHVLISRRSSKKLSNGSMSQRSICDNYVRTLISLPSKEYYNRPQLMSVYDSWHPYWQILCHISLPIKKTSKWWQCSVYDSWHSCRRTILFLCPPKNISNSHSSHVSVWFDHYIHVRQAICLIFLPIKETSKRWQWSVYDPWRPSRTLCRITLPTKERS